MLTLPDQVNYSEVAKQFGEGATYHSVEGQFRPLRKLADQMKAGTAPGLNGGAGAVVTPTANRTGPASKGSGAGSGRRGQSGKKDGVISGRVQKPEVSTPTKPAAKREGSVAIKREEAAKSVPSPPESSNTGESTGFDGNDDMDLVAFGNIDAGGSFFDYEEV